MQQSVFVLLLDTSFLKWGRVSLFIDIIWLGIINYYCSINLWGRRRFSLVFSEAEFGWLLTFLRWTSTLWCWWRILQLLLCLWFLSISWRHKTLVVIYYSGYNTWLVIAHRKDAANHFFIQWACNASLRIVYSLYVVTLIYIIWHKFDRLFCNRWRQELW